MTRAVLTIYRAGQVRVFGRMGRSAAPEPPPDPDPGPGGGTPGQRDFSIADNSAGVAQQFWWGT